MTHTQPTQKGQAMKTEILVITDRSGSMDTIASDVIGGFNAFIKAQREIEGQARVAYTQFDSVYEVVYEGKPLADVPPLTAETFQPRGNTALLDAIGRTLNEQGARIARDAWADLVIVVVITDGFENASKEYTLDRVRAMTAHAEKNGWKFIYLAANQDAFAAAKHLGMSGAVGQNFAQTSRGTCDAYATMSGTVGILRSGKP
jgi:uncharacterized protein with von Willebrand factor type A (vWA) domain